LKKFLIFAAILFAAYTWQKRVTAPPTVSSKYTSHNEVIMYSLTTCGHCKLMAGAHASRGHASRGQVFYYHI